MIKIVAVTLKTYIPEETISKPAVVKVKERDYAGKITAILVQETRKKAVFKAVITLNSDISVDTVGEPATVKVDSQVYAGETTAILIV